MSEGFEKYILDRNDKEGNFKKLINFYTNIWAGAKDGKKKKLIIKSCDFRCDCSSDSQCGKLEIKDLQLKKYLENDKKLYEFFLFNEKESTSNPYKNVLNKCLILNGYYKTHVSKNNLIIISRIIENFSEFTSKELLEPIEKFNKNQDYKKEIRDSLEIQIEQIKKILKDNNFDVKNLQHEKPLRKEQSFISKYCHWHREVNKSENHFPIFDKNVKYSLVYYQMTGTEIKKYKHLKYFVDKFIEEYLPEKYKDLDDRYKIKDRNESSPEKLVGVDRIKLKLEIKIEKTVDPNSLHEEISIYRLVDKFLWLQYEIHSKILKKNIENIGAFSPSKICYKIQDSQKQN